MKRPEGRPTEERLREAFLLLANETRLDVLYALWEAPDWTATFTELKEAVGMRDSGQFRYHLNQLEGTFVRRTEDGYTHLAGGIALYRAMLGSATGPESVEPISLSVSCSACGGDLRMTYENQVFYARCLDCGETLLSSPLPPAGLENRTDDERMQAFDRWSRRLFGLLSDGVCPWCASTVSHDIEANPAEPSGHGVRVRYTCDRCEGFLRTTVGETVLDHPAVISFCYQRGIDVTSKPHWELDFCTRADGARLVSEAPDEIRLDVEADGETLTLRLDGDLNVIEAETDADATDERAA